MRIAVLGDLHGCLDAHDLHWMQEEGFEAVLCVGDLGVPRTGRGGVLEVLAAMTVPVVVVPGNHDALGWPQFLAEVSGQKALADLLGRDQEARVAALADQLRPARLAGYEVVDLGAVQVVVGRPHSFGGPSLACAGYLGRRFGVADLEASRSRIGELLRSCDARPVLVLVHNGPTGLGDLRTSPFGRDFHPDQGDWGDPDLAGALDDFAEGGGRVAAVVAGHMHHALSGGGQRVTVGSRRGVPVVNAARVPRVSRGSRMLVELDLSADGVRVRELVRTEAGVVRIALA